jgi:PAS domain S-box-containing protein
VIAGTVPHRTVPARVQRGRDKKAQRMPTFALSFPSRRRKLYENLKIRLVGGQIVIEGRAHSRVVTEPVRDQDPLEALAGALAAPDERFRTLFETMPMGIVHYDADGSVIAANQAAGEILGLDLTAARTWPVVPVGQAVREDGSPFPREELPVLEALRTGRIVADAVAGIRHAKTGEFRWVRVTAVPDARDESGQPSRAYAIFIDLTEQRRTETALRQSTALLGRLRDANVLGVVVAGEHQVYEANDAYLDIIGYQRDDLEADRIAWREISPPEWAVVQDEALRQLRRAGVCQPFEKEYVHKDGHRVPVLIGSAAISRDPLRWTSFVVDLSARQRAERERAALLERARANRADAESARERLSFLMRAGALVAASRDRAELLDQVTHLVVPALADYCVVFLPTADGRLLATSLSHRVRARAGLLSRLRDHPVSTTGPLILQRAYSTGTTQLSRDVHAELAAWTSAEPEAIGIVKLMHPRSAIAVPFLGPNGPLGVIVLGRGTKRPRFAETDVQVIEELARRLTVGLANTDAFARDHAIAETLQRSLLPDTLPEIPGLDIAVRYLPATEGADVGGDWYDAFPLNGGLVGLVIGDVAGHNITSASIMGQVRSLLRGYAVDDPEPARVLERTNTAVTSLLPDVLASVAYAVLDPATGDLSYANRERVRRVPRRYGRHHAGRGRRHQLHRRPPAPFTGHEADLLHRRAHRRPASRYHRRTHRPRRDAAALRARVGRANVRHGRRGPPERDPSPR